MRPLTLWLEDGAAEQLLNQCGNQVPSDSPFYDLIEDVRDATFEVETAKRAIIAWSRAAGPEVWRNRHPMDVAKVERLRCARHDLHRAWFSLDRALLASRCGGSA